MNQALFGCAGGTGQVEGGPKVPLRQSSAAKSSHPAPKSQTYMCAQNTSYTPTQIHYTYTSKYHSFQSYFHRTQQSTTQHHWNANKTKEHNTIAQTVHNESSHPNVKSPTYMCAQTAKPSPSLRAILMRDFADTVMINLFQTQSDFFQTSSYHMYKTTADEWYLVFITPPLSQSCISFRFTLLFSRAWMQKANEL